jgi:outer membrane beta-barrel protein
MMKKALGFIFTLSLSGLVLASEKSLYEFSWLDKDKEIYVLQNRRYRKVNSFYLSLNGVKTISGAFVDSYGGAARAGYFFSEDWGIEGVFGKNSGGKNETAKGVEDQGSYAFYRKIESYMGAMVMWSPFYSKINTFNQVFYYDWMFGAGVASVNTKDNRKEFETPSTSDLTDENNLGAIWNTGLRVYISDSWSMRIDITGVHTRPKKENIESSNNSNKVTTSNIFSSYDLGLGLNYAF